MRRKNKRGIRFAVVNCEGYTKARRPALASRRANTDKRARRKKDASRQTARKPEKVYHLCPEICVWASHDGHRGVCAMPSLCRNKPAFSRGKA